MNDVRCGTCSLWKPYYDDWGYCQWDDSNIPLAFDVDRGATKDKECVGCPAWNGGTYGDANL